MAQPFPAFQSLPVAILIAALALPALPQSLLDEWEGDGIDDRYGTALANAGDVDGDGVDDLIVGSPDAALGRGTVEIRSGRDGSVFTTFTGIPGARLGQAVAGLGDVNGDGLSEVAFSATGESMVAGSTFHDPVRVWSQGAGNFIHTQWSLEDEQQGWSLAGGGDGDQDGLPDLLMGCPEHDPSGLVDAGRVRVIDFKPFGGMVVRTVLPGNQAGMQLGWDVAWTGDVDGDGFEDVVSSAPFRGEIGLPGQPGVGRIYVSDAHGFLHWSARGPMAADNHYGWSVAGGLDLTGDGMPDVVVGSPDYGGAGATGRVTIHRGTDGLTTNGRVGDSSGDRLGEDVALVVMDGAPFVLAGAPGDGETGGFTFLDRGVLHRLSAADLSTVWTAQGSSSWAYLGHAVTALGDANGDGSHEWAVSAPYTNTFQSNEPGLVRLFDGETHAAAWSQLGTGLAGTLGVPALAPNGVPQLGANVVVVIGNSLGAPTPAVLFLGVTESATPFKGGTLHLVPINSVSIPALPAPFLELVLSVPYDFTLSGFRLLFQAAQADTGAPFGVSLTPGLDLRLGP